MAYNPYFELVMSPTGKLNLDVDVRALAKDDFIYSLNTRGISNLGQTTLNREIILGNLEVFMPEAIALQNARFRITISTEFAYVYAINYYDANGNLLTTTTFVATAGDINTSLANLVTAINFDLAFIGQTVVVDTPVVIDTNTGYVDFEITTVNYWSYSVIINNAGANDPPIFSAVLIQEPVDASLLGEWNLIGSYNLIDALQTFWTTQKNLPSTFDISNIADNGAGLFEITTSTPHGRVSDEKVTINQSTTADGQWIITVTSPTTFTLNGSTYVAGWVSGGIVTANPNGNGEIDRATKNEQTGVWTNYRLIRSQKFNWVTKHQIHTYCDKNSNQKRYLGTDFYNKPFIVYDYTEVYQNDCLLNFIDPLNIYDYSNLGTEIILQLNTGDFVFGFTGQEQSGGNILSGNSRYAIQLGTDEGGWTDPSFLDSPIPATVDSEFGSGYQFFGRPAGTATPKINNFLVTGNILGIFTKIRLITVNYQGTAQSAYIVSEQRITGNSMVLQHTGFELATQDFDIGTLNQITKVITRAKSIDSLQGHILLANITTAPIIDLSTFFATMTYGIYRTTTLGNSIGSFILNNLDVGEYMDSNNVYRRVGYMLNERYRFGFIAEFTDGSLSPVFFSRDIIINTDNTQAGCNGTALPNYDLTTGAAGSQLPYSFYIKWDTPNFNTVINGVRVGDVVKRIYAMRCEVANRQVLASGIIIPSVSGKQGDSTSPAPEDYVTWVDPNNTATQDQIGEYPFVAGINEAFLPDVPVNLGYGAGGSVNNFTVNRNYFSFYSPDMFFGHTSITPQGGVDAIINYGQPATIRATYSETVAPHWDFDYYLEAKGETFNPPDIIPVDEAANIGKGGSATLNGLLFSKKLTVVTRPAGVFNQSFFDAPSSLVVYSVTPVQPLTAFAERPIYNAQYFREITNPDTQYGAKVDSRYVWTGTLLESDSSAAQFDVFGGDVFTQASYLKIRYNTQAQSVAPVYLLGLGEGIRFYSQNIVNSQMRNPNAGTGTPTAFPASNAPSVQTWLNNINLESISYNEGYTPRNGVTSYIAFDPNARISNTEPVQISFSQQYTYGSSEDNNRIFLPLNVKYLEYRYGEIVHIMCRNGDLYTWQPTKFDKPPFVPTEMMRTQAGTEILLGDGAPLSRVPIELSQYGCSNKWAIGEGIAAQGGANFYWTDTIKKAFLRYGYDGTTQQSNIHGMNSFFSNNLSIVATHDTPADDMGICCTWNERFKEFITTVRAWREDIDLWVNPVNPNLHDFAVNSAPYGDLVESGGLLYGTDSAAGGFGQLYSFDPLTSTFTVLHAFGGGADGLVPRAGVTLVGNSIYGTTTGGGTNGVGTIYEYNIGTATYTKRIDMVAAVGSQPACKMIEYNGYLWGMASAGGANGFGTIFRYDYIGSAYLDVFDFDGTTGGQLGGSSFNGLTLVGNQMYGMTYRGGANNVGAIFNFDPVLLTYTKLYDFNLLTGSSPSQSLTLLNNKLYGLTAGGGAYNKGVIFSYDYINNIYTDIHDFNGGAGDGQVPQSTLTAIGNTLYGTTAFGGASNLGTVFTYNTDNNTFSLVQTFTGANGQDPRGGLILYNNVMYGLARNGGGLGGGTIYSLALSYNTGDVVSIGTLTGFEQIPAFYRSLVDGNMSEPPNDTWELVPFSDYQYYNFYTFVFSEIKNGFDGFLTFHPKIYAPYTNTFLSPRPISDTGKMYEHNRGEYARWYNDGSTYQAEYGKFRGVCNINPTQTKKYKAARIRTEVRPKKVNFRTTSQQTYILDTDEEMLFREEKYDFPIMTDSTVTLVNSPNGADANPTGSNKADTSKLYGDYIEYELEFEDGVYQNLDSILIKGTYSDRVNNS